MAMAGSASLSCARRTNTGSSSPIRGMFSLPYFPDKAILSFLSLFIGHGFRKNGFLDRLHWQQVQLLSEFFYRGEGLNSELGELPLIIRLHPHHHIRRTL